MEIEIRTTGVTLQRGELTKQRVNDRLQPARKAYIYHCPSLLVVSSSNNSNSFFSSIFQSLAQPSTLYNTLY